jgi:hypothetical protein
MRIALLMGLGLVWGCAAQGDPVEGGPLQVEIPRVYPPVREATPTALIADATSAAPASESESELSAFGQARLAQSAPGSMATAIQDRFYTAGPTALLRIVKDLDDRVAGLETDPRQHECLTSAPVAATYTLPGGQAFEVKLQCLLELGGPGGSGWVAFGFDEPAAEADAGPLAASDGNDFYVVEGQAGGMGGVYRLDVGGNVEGWIAVADQSAPNNSQVLMHLLTNKVARTLELALAGSGVGFCGAHLKTDPDHVFVSGKTNGAAPPGSTVVGQYCDALRSGCFAVSALNTDLGADSASCAAIAPGSFDMAVELDASSDANANVDPATIYDYFNDRPAGVPSF